MFIKTGDLQPISPITVAPDTLDETARQSFEKAKKAAEEKSEVSKEKNEDK